MKAIVIRMIIFEIAHLSSTHQILNMPSQIDVGHIREVHTLVAHLIDYRHHRVAPLCDI
jgi:hypothetical protein